MYVQRVYMLNASVQFNVTGYLRWSQVAVRTIEGTGTLAGILIFIADPPPS